jgi:Dolichyl-phosphate-mannose-protein mannosyltransferase
VEARQKSPRPAGQDVRRLASPRWVSVVPVLLLALLWRVPSLFDPPWVNDEGTYFAVAQAMSHGFRLYSDVWENKPPALYLLYSAVYHSVGPSLVAIRLLAALAVLATAVLVFQIALRFTGHRAALLAAMIYGLLMDVPFLEGTTGNAEVFLSVFTALGVYLALVRGRPSAAGLSMGVACLFKAVAGFDLLALGIWLVVQLRTPAWCYALGAVAVFALVAALAAADGILAPLLRNAGLYDLGYVGHANGGGLPWVLMAKLLVLAILTFALRAAPFPYLWLVYAAAGALVSGRFFGHYALQAVAPFSVCLAMAVERRGLRPRRMLVALPLAFLSLAILSSAIGWSLSSSGHDSILIRRLQWYGNFVRYASGQESYVTYSSQIDDHVNRNIRVAAVLDRLPRGKLLVWGNTPWIYVLARRLPATPYTSALRDPLVPGETTALRTAIIDDRPREIVVISPPLPPLGSAVRALGVRYRVVAHRQNATVYVRRG